MPKLNKLFRRHSPKSQSQNEPEPEVATPENTDKQKFKMKKESGGKTVFKAELEKNDIGVISGHGVLVNRRSQIHLDPILNTTTANSKIVQYKLFAVLPKIFLVPMIESGENLKIQFYDDFKHHATTTNKKYNNYYPPGSLIQNQSIQLFSNFGMAEGAHDLAERLPGHGNDIMFGPSGIITKYPNDFYLTKSDYSDKLGHFESKKIPLIDYARFEESIRESPHISSHKFNLTTRIKEINKRNISREEKKRLLYNSFFKYHNTLILPEDELLKVIDKSIYYDAETGRHIIDESKYEQKSNRQEGQVEYSIYLDQIFRKIKENYLDKGKPEITPIDDFFDVQDDPVAALREELVALSKDDLKQRARTEVGIWYPGKTLNDTLDVAIKSDKPKEALIDIIIAAKLSPDAHQDIAGFSPEITFNESGPTGIIFEKGKYYHGSPIIKKILPKPSQCSSGQIPLCNQLIPGMRLHSINDILSYRMNYNDIMKKIETIRPIRLKFTSKPIIDQQKRGGKITGDHKIFYLQACRGGDKRKISDFEEECSIGEQFDFNRIEMLSASEKSDELVLPNFGGVEPDEAESGLTRQFSFSKKAETTDFMYNMERFKKMIEDNTLDYSKFTTSLEIGEEKKEAIIKLLFYLNYKCAKDKFFLTDLGFCVIYSLFDNKFPLNKIKARIAGTSFFGTNAEPPPVMLLPFYVLNLINLYYDNVIKDPYAVKCDARCAETMPKVEKDKHSDVNSHSHPEHGASTIFMLIKELEELELENDNSISKFNTTASIKNFISRFFDPRLKYELSKKAIDTENTSPQTESQTESTLSQGSKRKSKRKSKKRKTKKRKSRRKTKKRKTKRSRRRTRTKRR